MIKIVVADRGKADVYETANLGERLARVKSFANDAARKHERALVSDAPGRVFNRSAGIHQSFGERHRLRDDATKAFVRTVIEALESDVRSTKCSGFVLIAAPRLLSQFRASVPRLLSVKLLEQIPKDLSHQSEAAIQGQLRSWRRRSVSGETQGHSLSAASRS